MEEQLIQMALEAGADKAEIISTAQIVTSDEFREACRKNLCGQWGRCWMCPPDVGDIEPLMAQIRTYQHGLWYQSIGQLEDSFDIEGMSEAKHRHVLLSQRLEERIRPLLGRHLHLCCGGCGLCERCARLDDQPCRFPDKAMPSLESYGVNVYQTTSSTSLKYINGQNTVTYFSLVLF